MFTRIGVRMVSFGVLLAVAAMAAPAAANTFITLDDLNSQIRFTPDAGVIGWDVDGVNQLKRQGFWYRLEGQARATLGNGSGLGFYDLMPSDTDYDDGDETLSVRYGNPNPGGFGAVLTYTLSGEAANSHKSHLVENIAFNNQTAQAVHLQFYQYCDFDLSDPNDADTVQFVNANTMVQQGAGMRVAETVVSPPPALTEVAMYNATLVKLNTTSADLDGTQGPLGPADVTWAFQWDLTVPAGQTIQISKIKNVTPEPATLTLMGLGLAATVAGRRRRKA